MPYCRPLRYNFIANANYLSFLTSGKLKLNLFVKFVLAL